MNKIKKISPLSHWSLSLSKGVAIGSILLVTAMFAACGDEVTEVTQVVGMQVVEEGESMPKCTTEKEGQMVYSVDSAAAYYCINRKWTSMKGEDGKDGKSGSNGKNGSDGTSCTAVEIDDGYKIVCGKDSVGVVLNGAKGDKGEKGKDGDNGNDGEKGSDGASCTAVAIDGGYKIVCGDDSVGVVLNGTNGTNGINGVDGKNCEIVSDTNGVITLECGDDMTTLYKAMCGINAYDPAKQFCDTRNNKVYKYVTIGNHVWMAENLNYKVDSSFCYNDSAKYCEKYGRLYLWSAAIGRSEEECGAGKICSLPEGNIQGVCPVGWHLPSKDEFYTLFDAAGDNLVAGLALKSRTGWNDGGNGTDAFGFSALPAGLRSYYNRSFTNEGHSTYFWSTFEGDAHDAFIINMHSTTEIAYMNGIDKYAALSVRCVKD